METSTELHLWSFAAKKLEIGVAAQHGLCGVHIGRFTSDPDKVTCNNCLTIINAKERNGSQAAG
jgi:hypothetical protein